jgi:hypothetical protein
MDEVMYADPAANLYFHGRFTSTAWYTPGGEDGWAGNVPLHPLLLWLWLCVFGFSVTAVRSMNFVLLAVAVGMLWWQSARRQWIRWSQARLALVLLLFSGFGLTFAYRSGRPDMIVLLLASLAFIAATAGLRWSPQLLAALCALIPFAGLQGIPFVIFATAVVLAAFRPRPLRLASAAVGGLILGFCVLLGLYAATGLLDQFLQSVRGHTVAGRSPPQTMADLWRAYARPSLVACWLVAGYGLVRRRKDVAPDHWARSVLLLLGVVLCPALMQLAGKFPIYYTWMSYVPSAMLAIAVLESSWPAWSRLEKCSSALLLSAAVALGLPARLFVTALEWDLRDPGVVETALSDEARRSDHVVSAWQAYYYLKPRVAKLYLRAELLRADQAERVSLVIGDQELLQEVRRRGGGEWRRMAVVDTPKAEWRLGRAGLYEFEAWRRQ